MKIRIKVGTDLLVQILLVMVRMVLEMETYRQSIQRNAVSQALGYHVYHYPKKRVIYSV